MGAPPFSFTSASPLGLPPDSAPWLGTSPPAPATPITAGTFRESANPDGTDLGIGRVKGRVWIIGLFLLANMLPQEALVYPLYFFAKQVGLYNTQLSVIIIFTVIQSAFGTYLLASVLSTFPRSVLEAARLDGASRWQVLWRVIFPITRPTLSVLVIFFFIWTWNEFFIPLVMLISNSTQTVPVALATLQGDRLMDAPTTNAGALISLIPCVVFFLIFQRTLTRGVMAGAEK